MYFSLGFYSLRPSFCFNQKQPRDSKFLSDSKRSFSSLCVAGVLTPSVYFYALLFPPDPIQTNRLNGTCREWNSHPLPAGCAQSIYLKRPREGWEGIKVRGHLGITLHAPSCFFKQVEWPCLEHTIAHTKTIRRENKLLRFCFRHHFNKGWACSKTFWLLKETSMSLISFAHSPGPFWSVNVACTADLTRPQLTALSLGHYVIKSGSSGQKGKRATLHSHYRLFWSYCQLSGYQRHGHHQETVWPASSGVTIPRGKATTAFSTL